MRPVQETITFWWSSTFSQIIWCDRPLKRRNEFIEKGFENNIQIGQAVSTQHISLKVFVLRELQGRLPLIIKVKIKSKYMCKCVFLELSACCFVLVSSGRRSFTLRSVLLPLTKPRSLCSGVKECVHMSEKTKPALKFHSLCVCCWIQAPLGKVRISAAALLFHCFGFDA